MVSVPGLNGRQTATTTTTTLGPDDASDDRETVRPEMAVDVGTNPTICEPYGTTLQIQDVAVCDDETLLGS